MSDTQLFDNDTFAVVEVLGHKTFAGKVSQHVIGGTAFIRVDVPEIPAHTATEYGYETAYPAIPGFTTLIGANSIYAITPCTEGIAIKTATAKRQIPIEVLTLEPKSRRMALAMPASCEDDDESDPSKPPF